MEQALGKCMVCGEQATFTCKKAGSLNCWTTLCDRDLCKLLHLYIAHPNLIAEISKLENELKVEPVKILVGKINQPSITDVVIYKAGFLIPYEGGGFLWTTLCVHETLSGLEEDLEGKLKDANEREVMYTDQFFNSKIPSGLIEGLIS